ncbi:hypothetical protein DV737_g4223, partial [Chaetothyriales sp. CBS 132003]
MSLSRTGTAEGTHSVHLALPPTHQFQLPKKNVIAIKSADGRIITPASPETDDSSDNTWARGDRQAKAVPPTAARRPLSTSIVGSASPPAASAHKEPNPSKAGLAKLSTLNIYASIHVPDWLVAINESVATHVACVQFQHFNAQEYASQTGADIHVEPLYFNPMSLGAHDEILPTLEQTTYESYFSSRLHAEVRALELQLMQYSLFQHSIVLKDPHDLLYQVQVPGLRENSPRVDIGDIVLVRPLSALPSAVAAQESKRWRQHLQPLGIRHPAFLGMEYRAVVWSVHRASETVLLQIDTRAHLPPTANLRFIAQSQKIEPLLRAVQMIHRGLGVSNLLKSMLFPEKSDGVTQTKLSSAKFDIDWIDRSLNFEQQKAVAAVIADRYGSVPYLISGPPGTGKTRTIVEISLQLLARKKSGVQPHLLICAPSDAAADTLAIRLSHHLSQEQMFRLNGWTRTYAEVPDRLMLYSHSTQNNTFGLPPFHKLMSYSVVVTTCRDASMLVEARLTNKDLAQLVFNSLFAVSPSAAESLKPSLLHWTALLFDEAAQATEPESLIPLSVILPLWIPPSCLYVYPQFVLAGDEFQLGPRVISHSQNSGLGLGISLFQRVFNRAFYANHPLSRANGLRPLTRNLLPLPRPAFANLIRNYRSHPAILSVPSSLFYYDTLIPESAILSTAGAVSTWPGWHKPNWPVLFLQNSGPDEVDDILAGDGTGAGSLYNNDELTIMSRVVHSLLGQISGLAREQIVVMSPFRAQVARIRRRLRDAGLAAVNVGPLEAFQGLESRLVILCTTRTRRGGKQGVATAPAPAPAADHFVRQDQDRGLGIIDEPKRFNVALTRAMEGLIVIGDATTLTVTGDRCWRAFLAFCARNGLVRGGALASCDDSDLPPGRLERVLRQKDSANTSAGHHQRVIGLRGFVEDGEEEGEMVLPDEDEDEENDDNDYEDNDPQDTDADTDTDTADRW